MNFEESLRLRHMEKVELISKEEEEERNKLMGEMNRMGALSSGGTAAGLARIKIEGAEKKLLALIDSVKELIDLGVVKPDSAWKAKILPYLERNLKSLETVHPNPLPFLRGGESIIVSQFKNALPGLQGRVRRRFELMFFDEAARATMDRKGPISIGTLNVTGIANLGEIIGDINQSINQVQSAGSEEIANILKELSQAVIGDPKLEKQNRQEAIENIRTLAEQASIPEGQRTMGVVKAALLYIPSLLSASTDVLNYFHINLEQIKRFFGI